MKCCLYCGKPCSETAPFCDGCRVSLLKRQHSLDKVEEASSSPLLAEQELAIQPARVGVLPKMSLAENAAETFEEKPALPVSSGPPFTPVSLSLRSLPSSIPALAPPRRRVSMPTPARIALIVLAVGGMISLIAGGILFATHIPLYHPVPSAGAAAPGKTNTSPSPASGTLGPGTRTGTSTTTPGAGKRWLQLSSPHLAFQYTQGQASPAGQAVTIRNADGSAFSWQVNAVTSSPWLSVAPVQGAVSAGGIGRAVVSVQTAQLTPNVYRSQLSISATSSTGASLQNSPQILTVTLAVLAPCVLQATPAQLSFTATLLQQNPAGQTIALKATGGCGLPVTWTVMADASWVQFSSSSGSDSGAGSSVVVSPHTKSILGTYTAYTAYITLTAADSDGKTAQSSPQMITVTLYVIA